MSQSPVEVPTPVRATVERVLAGATIAEVEREKAAHPAAEANYKLIVASATGRKVAVIVTPAGGFDHQVELRLEPSDVPAAALAAVKQAMGGRAIEKIARITYSGRDAYFRFSHAKEHWRFSGNGTAVRDAGIK